MPRESQRQPRGGGWIPLSEEPTRLLGHLEPARQRVGVGTRNVLRRHREELCGQCFVSMFKSEEGENFKN